MAKLQEEFLNTVKLSQQDSRFRLCELPFLRGREVASIINGPCIEDVEAISSSRVHVWIKQRAAKQPSAVALYSAERDETMTYRDLEDRSSQIAHYLAAKGVAPGDGVLLNIARGFNTVVWLLGILKAGAYYVILDKKLPDRRKAAITATSEARFLVTDDLKIHQVVSHLAVMVVSLDVIERELRTQPHTMLESTLKDNNLAYSRFNYPQVNTTVLMIRSRIHVRLDWPAKGGYGRAFKCKPLRERRPQRREDWAGQPCSSVRDLFV